MNGGSGAKRATSVHALDQSAEIDGKYFNNWGTFINYVYKKGGGGTSGNVNQCQR